MTLQCPGVGGRGRSPLIILYYIMYKGSKDEWSWRRLAKCLCVCVFESQRDSILKTGPKAFKIFQARLDFT